MIIPQNNATIVSDDYLNVIKKSSKRNRQTLCDPLANLSHLKSLLTYFLLACGLIVFSLTYYPKYKQAGTEATISWDVSGYYWYLPAAFIYKDLKGLNFSDSIRNTYGCSPDNQQITFLPDGTKVLKYSCGMAVQYLPFFLMAHLVAKPLGYLNDGFSLPYQLAIQLGALLMCLLGLWYLRKLLLEYFKDSTVAWVLFLLVMGTNYLNYASIDVGMTHSWLFTWYCLLLYQSYHFYKNPSLKRSAIIGFILGIMALSRPTEILAVLIPMLWGLNFIKVKAIKERLLFFRNHFTKYLLTFSVMFLVGSIQLLYWKYATGHWLVYSYGDQHFTWLHPHVINYIFSYRCGWLIYCPLMLLPYIGFLYLMKKKELFWTLALFSIGYLWIVTAWDIYWYGGRAMIQGYPVLMFPLAALIESVNTRRIAMLLFYPLVFLFLYLNIWWTHGVHKGGIVYAADMSKAYYTKIVGRWHINEQDRKLLDVSDDFTGTKQDLDTLFTINFNQNQANAIIDNDSSHLLLKSDSSAFVSYTILPNKQKLNWIRASADIQCVRLNWDILRMTQFGMRFFNGERCIKENTILLDRLFYKNPTQRIYIDAHIKPDQYDSMQVFFRNTEQAQGSFFIRNLLVEGFN